MKKMFRNKKIYSLLVLGLILGSIRGPLFEVSERSQNSRDIIGDKSSVAEAVKVITSSVFSPEIVVVDAETQSSYPSFAECQLAVKEHLGALQSQASLNLNQPANCFSLAKTSVAAAGTNLNLQVNSLKTAVVAVRVLPVQAIAKDNFKLPLPEGGNSALPVMPITGFMFVVLVSWAWRLAPGKNHASPESDLDHANQLSLQKLMVMRC